MIFAPDAVVYLRISLVSQTADRSLMQINDFRLHFGKTLTMTVITVVHQLHHCPLFIHTNTMSWAHNMSDCHLISRIKHGTINTVWFLVKLVSRK